VRSNARFYLASLDSRDPLQLNSVDLTTLKQLVQHRHFICITCDHQLAAPIDAQVPFIAVVLKSRVAITRETSLEAIGVVVEPRVQDAAVAPACVYAAALFLLEKDHAAVRVASLGLNGDPQADYAATNDQKIR
jgi:hypothetical protein